MKTEQVHVSKIRGGDCVRVRGEFVTICQNDITEGGFMGRTIQGESFRGGAVLVERVLFPKWLKGTLVGYFPQV
jgi:hypothetical protein